MSELFPELDGVFPNATPGVASSAVAPIVVGNNLIPRHEHKVEAFLVRTAKQSSSSFYSAYENIIKMMMTPTLI